MSGLENSIRLLDILSEAEDKGCPLPTQNIDLNLKNRNIAFKKYNYGPTEPIIKVGEIGYCRFLKFKCAAARTCQAWVSGGPITK